MKWPEVGVGRAGARKAEHGIKLWKPFASGYSWELSDVWMLVVITVGSFAYTGLPIMEGPCDSFQSRDRGKKRTHPGNKHRLRINQETWLRAPCLPLKTCMILYLVISLISLGLDYASMKGRKHTRWNLLKKFVMCKRESWSWFVTTQVCLLSH